MDYTKFPRQLIYRDRTDMNEFDVEKTGTSDGWFLDNLKKRPFILKTEKAADYALRIFNDAHYICTLFFLQDHEELYFAKYLSIAAHDEDDEIWTQHGMPATMALVYNLMLPHSREFGEKEYKNPYEKFRKYIWRHFWSDEKSALDENDDFFDLVQDTLYPNTSGYEFEPISIYDIIKKVPAQIIAEGIDYVRGDIIGRVEPVLLLKLYRKLKTADNENDTIRDAITATEGAMRDFGLTVPGDTDTLIEDEEKGFEIILLKKRVKELEQEVEEQKEFKERQQNRHGINKHLVAVLGQKLAPKLGITVSNKKNLAPVLSQLFGWGERKLEQEMSQPIKNEDELALANIFGPLSPELARYIYPRWEDNSTSNSEVPPTA